jgi:hypothetical protein
MLVVITLTPAAATTAITIKTMVAMAGDTPRLSFNKFLFFVFFVFIFFLVSPPNFFFLR